MVWLNKRVAAVFLAASFAPAAVHAQQADPAAATVDALHSGLIATMKAGAKAGQAGRARVVTPYIDRAFDLGGMIRLAVGPGWATMKPQEQAGLQAAFRNLTIAQYAKNFSSFGGERFESTGPVQARGADKLVSTRIVIPASPSESLNYRLRLTGGQWKILDVYYRNSISQLATRRADFARVLEKGGAPALIEHINRVANRPQ